MSTQVLDVQRAATGRRGDGDDRRAAARSSVRAALRRVVRQLGFNKRVRVHTLRHDVASRTM